MPWNDEALAPQLPSLCCRARQPHLLTHGPQRSTPSALEALLLKRRGRCREKPARHHRRGAPGAPQLERSLRSVKAAGRLDTQRGSLTDQSQQDRHSDILKASESRNCQFTKEEIY